MNGASGTPLIDKLGYAPGHRVGYVNAPDGFGELVGALPDGCAVRDGLAGGALDVIVCFVTRRRLLEQRLPALRRAMGRDGMLWVAWPKRSSGVATDMTDDVVRDLVLPTGLVDTKVCAIDDTWSGLRLVVRKELR